MANENIKDIDEVIKVIDNAKSNEKENIQKLENEKEIARRKQAKEDIETIDLIVSILGNTTKNNSSTISEKDCDTLANKVISGMTNSIGEHGKIDVESEKQYEEEYGEEIEFHSEKTRKIAAGVCLAVSLFASTILVDATLNDFKMFTSIKNSANSIKSNISAFFDDLDRTKTTDRAVHMLDSYYNKKLIDNGLATTISSRPDPFVIYKNSVQNYEKLGANDIVDVYICYRILPEGEFSKFIKSVSYNDTEGNICNYTDFEQFLRINGYPDVKTFENYAESTIYKLYQEGKIGYLENGQMYFLDSNIQKVGRGGL